MIEAVVMIFGLFSYEPAICKTRQSRMVGEIDFCLLPLISGELRALALSSLDATGHDAMTGSCCGEH